MYRCVNREDFGITLAFSIAVLKYPPTSIKAYNINLVCFTRDLLLHRVCTLSHW